MIKEPVAQCGRLFWLPGGLAALCLWSLAEG